MNDHFNLDTETLDHAFPSEPLLVEHDTPVRNALRLMQEKNEGFVLICRAGKLEGIFTERDALRLMVDAADLDVSIQEVMTRDPDSLSAEASVAQAVSMMSSKGYRRIPIVDRAGRPTGLLKVTGILHFLVEHFPRIVYTLPPEPHHGMRKREGA